MPTDNPILAQLMAIKAMAGMRGDFGPENALNVTTTLLDEGYNIFELTMNSDQPIAALKALKDAHGDAAYVGMGTVLSVETAKQVMDAGGDFIVSPSFQPEVVRYVLDAGVLMIPGVITPTEALAAWNMGVPLLKLFPIGTLGVDYFKAMFGPLNHMRFMCNGGMNADNARAFVQSGAAAAGMSGWLTGNGTTPEATIRERAQTLRAALDNN